MRSFKRVALATAVSAGVMGIGSPAHAVIEGVPAEALLVPLVVEGDWWPIGLPLPPGQVPLVNTVVAIETPQFLGVDAVPNQFTAPHVAPTLDQGRTAFDPTCVAIKGGIQNPYQTENCDHVHWYFFDRESKHRWDGTFKVTPNDLYIFDWRLESARAFNNEAGYLVFTTAAASELDPATGYTKDANFAMWGEAQLIIDPFGVGDLSAAHIPVLGMADGSDDEGGPNPNLLDSVKYNAAEGVPELVSPLASGMRIANGDGDNADFMRFKVTLGPRDRTDNVWVTWLDANYGIETTVLVYDENENQCSSPVPLPYELNIVWIEDAFPPAGGNPGTATLSPAYLLSPLVNVIERAFPVCVPEGPQIAVSNGLGQLVAAWPFQQRGLIVTTLRESQMSGADIVLPSGGASASGVSFMLTVFPQIALEPWPFGCEAIDWRQCLGIGVTLQAPVEDVVFEHASDLGKWPPVEGP